MDGTQLSEMARRSNGIANGVQTGYADALKGMPNAGRVPPSIGYQCSPYEGGKEPPAHPAADPSVSVGSGQRIRD